MSEFRESVEIRASRGEVFAYVSEFDNISNFVPMVRKLEPQGDGRVRVIGSVDGQSVDRMATFQASSPENPISWSVEDTNYSGRMDIEAVDNGTSRVTVTLDMPHFDRQSDDIKNEWQGIGSTIRAEMRECLGKLKQSVEQTAPVNKSRLL